MKEGEEEEKEVEQRVPATTAPPEVPHVSVVKKEVPNGGAVCQRDLGAVEEGVQML